MFALTLFKHFNYFSKEIVQYITMLVDKIKQRATANLHPETPKKEARTWFFSESWASQKN